MFISSEPLEVAGTQTISRAFRALRLVAAQAPHGIRLVDLSHQLGLERPTAHRLLKALVQEGMLVQQAGTRRYSLGPQLFELGISATHQFNLKDICQPVCAALAEQTGDTAFLFLRSGFDAVCIARIQGTYPIQTPSVPVGSRQPLGVSAGGLALLSALSVEEMATVIAAVEPRLAAYGDLDADKLRDLCASAKRAGYATTGNHAVPGVRAIGLPIFDRSNTPIAAITVAATQSRMDARRIATLLPMLKTAAAEVTRLLRQ
ncbi:IclR family transcriptional regulator [Limnohabitans sp. JirII-31]|uniref:IclR family transcriptional regulator n=1 Tax=Limnohabitans sp. JirII-31 TaxID=1977908 RepID=UPI001E388BE6|nr:IclR family transcriptional regulator [Limnohabitans sp. JirII-31]